MAMIEGKRRSWSVEERQRIVDEALSPGASVAATAQQHGVNANLVFKWIRRGHEGWLDRRRGPRISALLSAPAATPGFVPVEIRYATSRWVALTRFLDDGRLEISNNAAERAIRPLTLGRKNYLFAGSDASGRRAAILYTLIETARFNGINPAAWLTDVIARIADHPNSRIDEMLPWAWGENAPQIAAA